MLPSRYGRWCEREAAAIRRPTRFIVFGRDDFRKPPCGNGGSAVVYRGRSVSTITGWTYLGGADPCQGSRQSWAMHSNRCCGMLDCSLWALLWRAFRVLFASASGFSFQDIAESRCRPRRSSPASERRHIRLRLLRRFRRRSFPRFARFCRIICGSFRRT